MYLRSSCLQCPYLQEWVWVKENGAWLQEEDLLHVYCVESLLKEEEGKDDEEEKEKKKK